MFVKNKILTSISNYIQVIELLLYRLDADVKKFLINFRDNLVARLYMKMKSKWSRGSLNIMLSKYSNDFN